MGHKMNTVLIALSIFTVVLSMPLEVEWNQWRQLHGKIYSDEDEQKSKMTWLENYQYIQKHNSENHQFKLGLNEFADMVSLLLTLISFSYKVYQCPFSLMKNSSKCICRNSTLLLRKMLIFTRS